MRKLQNNEHKEVHIRQQNTIGVPSNLPPALDYIPPNVKYEEGTHIELELIGASLFMPWQWLRVKELSPKSASISVFSNGFAGDLK